MLVLGDRKPGSRAGFVAPNDNPSTRTPGRQRLRATRPLTAWKKEAECAWRPSARPWSREHFLAAAPGTKAAWPLPPAAPAGLQLHWDRGEARACGLIEIIKRQLKGSVLLLCYPPLTNHY